MEQFNFYGFEEFGFDNDDMDNTSPIENNNEQNNFQQQFNNNIPNQNNMPNFTNTPNFTEMKFNPQNNNFQNIPIEIKLENDNSNSLIEDGIEDWNNSPVQDTQPIQEISVPFGALQIVMDQK